MTTGSGSARPPRTRAIADSMVPGSIPPPVVELISEETRDRRLLRALDVSGTGQIPRRALAEAVARVGLRADDVRLAESMQRLAEYRDDAVLSTDEMVQVMRPNVSLIERALRGNLVIPDFPGFCDEILEIYEETRNIGGGKVADYIPQLARVPAKHYGVSVCTQIGRYSAGAGTFCNDRRELRVTSSLGFRLDRLRYLFA